MGLPIVIFDTHKIPDSRTTSCAANLDSAKEALADRIESTQSLSFVPPSRIEAAESMPDGFPEEQCSVEM